MLLIIFTKFLLIDYFDIFFICANYALFSFYLNKGICTVVVVTRVFERPQQRRACIVKDHAVLTPLLLAICGISVSEFVTSR